MHLMTGHLSHQIEHHLFPDLPAARYPEMAPRVREICARYGQAYNTGSFLRQLGSVAARLVRLSRPTRTMRGHGAVAGVRVDDVGVAHQLRRSQHAGAVVADDPARYQAVG